MTNGTITFTASGTVTQAITVLVAGITVDDVVVALSCGKYAAALQDGGHIVDVASGVKIARIEYSAPELNFRSFISCGAVVPHEAYQVDVFQIDPALLLAMHDSDRCPIDASEAAKIRSIADHMKRNGYDHREPVRVLKRRRNGMDMFSVTDGKARAQAAVLAIREGGPFRTIPIKVITRVQRQQGSLAAPKARSRAPGVSSAAQELEQVLCAA